MKVFRPCALVGALFGMLAFGGVGSAAAQDSEHSTADGVYSDDQSDRGKDVFNMVCSDCHLPAEFKGIVDDWAGSSMFEVFDGIRTTMPEDGPGSLRNQEYADVVAYILDLNGVPAGSVELAGETDTLRGIRVTAPPEQQ